jgi:5'-3' exonuclease
VAKFGVKPKSIPDYLALVGDTADGFPGLPGWGPKSAGAIIGRYQHLEEIPQDWRHWDIPVRNARQLSIALLNGWNDVLLFRHLATLRTDVPVRERVDDLLWKGPHPEFEDFCTRLRAPALLSRAKQAVE